MEQIETRNYFRKVYAWMTVGLALSGFTSFAVASNAAFVNFVLGNNWVFLGLIIVQVGVVFWLAAGLKKMSPELAFFLFLLYCFLTGLTLSTIFLVYTLSSIATVFFITAGMFGAMSLYGFFAKRDLTGLGHMLVMALIGVIIAMLVNLFLRSTGFDLALSILSVVIFTGLTAYDTQKLKRLNVIGNEGTPEDRKETVLGALTLYLDFINLFLNLLRLMGRRRD